MELNGGGKYDEQCERTLIELRANAVLLIVLGGTKGPGFSASAIDARYLETLPEMLEQVAGDIRRLRDADKPR